ncbi:MAG: hypothetical protein EOT05_03785 [Candidatus Microsaccharimonas sossegonensis]|uniref:Uncharacterized protein n=1 Tax=Candidatus Microsaccharimonas sossegonensis TaxID=2506948 RepID=A0A4Q0AIG1_9BACT|nr:MAG: hypothetical protein EOT05_03785 [Candidatus Microsaccharimonas sossegonensis]
MSGKKHNGTRALLAGLFSFVLVGTALFLLFNQQYIKDQITVWSFKPPAKVQNLEKNINFTNKGAFYFYAQQPEINGSTDFNKNCQRQEVGNPILGCYIASRIYIFDVTNTQLNGIEEVTAAHETMHAIWERMTMSERTRMSVLLEAAYAKLGSNANLKQRMDYYKRTEPGQFDNELFAIVGTEIPNLSPELEAYYKQYFNDRQKVVDYQAKYAAVFSGLKSQSDSLYTQLKTLGASIEARSTQYDTNVKQLSADIASFNARANNGGFSSMNEFNTERAALLKRSNQLDADRASISAAIDTYNATYAEYQKVSSEIEALNKSIDSIKELQPTPSV